MNHRTSYGQTIDYYKVFVDFSHYYVSGDLVSAENILLRLLSSPDSIPIKYRMAAYNNLGVIYSSTGNYQDALNYYSKAEILIKNITNSDFELGNIYVNKGIIYEFQKAYQPAIEYFEKGLRIYNKVKKVDKTFYQSVSSTYLNLGIAYLEMKC